MRTKRLLLLFLILAAACKPPTPAEQMESILSWIGTARVAGDAWLRHTTPDTYTRQTLELSSKTLGHISKDLLESTPTVVNTDVLDSVLTNSRKRIARMATLVAAKNAPGFARELDLLRADHMLVKQFSHGLESKE